MAKSLDLTNQRFGRLVALEPLKERKDGQIVWRCQCDCRAIAEQQINKRNNRLITYKGKTQCVAEWIRELKLDKKRTYNRIAQGWTDVEKIFFSV